MKLGILADIHEDVDQDGDIAIEEHLTFHCPDLRCCHYLDSLPDPFAAVMRVIWRRHLPGRRW